MKMNKYPGPTMRVGYGYQLNEAQLEWLKEIGPMRENSWICKQMGISEGTLHRMMRRYGIVKSEAGMKAIIRRRIKKIKRTCEKSGYYDSLRGKAPSEEAREGSIRFWREHPDFHPFKNMSKKKRKALAERKSVKHKELWRKERLRHEYGLPRQTKLRVVSKAYTHLELRRRHLSLQYGYILPTDLRDEAGERYVIYYDDETRRNEKFEKNSIERGFRFEKL